MARVGIVNEGPGHSGASIPDEQQVRRIYPVERIIITTALLFRKGRRTSAANCGKRSQVRYTIEVLVQGIFEYLLTAARGKKQGQAGA